MLKKIIAISTLIILFCGCVFAGCTNDEEEVAYEMYIIIGDNVLTAEMSDNASAEALKDRLQDGDVTIKMRDYGNMEKVGSLGDPLPSNDKYIHTQAGDLILYQGNQFVIYYDDNSWSLTRLGKIKDVTAQSLKDILGSGDVEVVLTLNEPKS